MSMLHNNSHYMVTINLLVCLSHLSFIHSLIYFTNIYYACIMYLVWRYSSE